MFCDYINYNSKLYDGIKIDRKTIEYLNNYFMFYYVYPQEFYYNYRRYLARYLPTYYLMLKNEMRDDLLSISTNQKYTRIVDNTLNKLFQDNLININNDGKSDGTNNTTNENKDATRQTPMSVINESENFEDLFDNWETANNKNQTLNQNDNTTHNEYENHSNERNKLYNIIKKMSDKGIRDNELNNLVIESVDKIYNFLAKNKSVDYLVEQVKPTFITISIY